MSCWQPTNFEQSPPHFHPPPQIKPKAIGINSKCWFSFTPPQMDWTIVSDPPLHCFLSTSNPLLLSRSPDRLATAIGPILGVGVGEWGRWRIAPPLLPEASGIRPTCKDLTEWRWAVRYLEQTPWSRSARRTTAYWEDQQRSCRASKPSERSKGERARRRPSSRRSTLESSQDRTAPVNSGTGGLLLLLLLHNAPLRKRGGGKERDPGRDPAAAPASFVCCKHSNAAAGLCWGSRRGGKKGKVIAETLRRRIN